MKIASLDLGTNSLILVVAEWDGTTLTPLFEDVQVVRLGQGLAKRGSLHPKAKRRCLKELRNFSEKIDQFEVKNVLAAGAAAPPRRPPPGEAAAPPVLPRGPPRSAIVPDLEGTVDGRPQGIRREVVEDETGSRRSVHIPWFHGVGQSAGVSHQRHGPVPETQHLV